MEIFSPNLNRNFAIYFIAGCNTACFLIFYLIHYSKALYVTGFNKKAMIKHYQKIKEEKAEVKR